MMPRKCRCRSAAKWCSTSRWNGSSVSRSTCAVDPVLGAGAKQQRVLEALGLEVAEQVLVRPQSQGAALHTTVPLVEHERKGPPLAVLQEQVPAQAVVVLLLRADVQHDVGHRQQ